MLSPLPAERAQPSAARLRVLRYGGLAATLALAVAGGIAGAFPKLPGYVTPVTLVRGPHGALLTVLWVAGTAGIVTAWWTGLATRTTARWAYVTAALWALPMALTVPYGSRDAYAYACQGALYNGGLNPYHDGVSALPCPWLGSVSVIWRDTPTPYGAIWIALEGLAVRIGHTLTGTVIVLRVLAIIGLLLAGACLPVLARVTRMPLDRAVWTALACPLVPLFLVGGAHSDALTIGFLLAALAVIARRPDRTVALLLGGALLGAAVSLKITIIVVVPFAIVLAVGGGWHLAAFTRKALAIAGAAAAVLVASSLISGLGFGWITALRSAGDSVQWTSPPTAVGLTVTYLSRFAGVPIDGVAIVRALSLALMVVALIGIFLRFRAAGPRHGDVFYGAALAMCATILLAPITQPWYLTWPLAMCAVVPLARTWWVAALAAVGTVLLLPDGLSLARFSNPALSPVVTLVCAYALWRILRTKLRRSPSASGSSGPSGSATGTRTTVPDPARPGPASPS